MDETLKHFLESIEAQSWNEINAMSQEVAADHEEKTGKVLSDAEQQADLTRQAELSDIARDERLSLDARKAENRRRLLNLRGECIAQAEEEVLRRVKDYTEAPEYPACLSVLAERGLAALRVSEGNAEIYLRAADMCHADGIVKRVKGVRLTPKEGEFRLGGVIVEAPDLGRRADLSYDAGFVQARERFTEIFGLELP